MQHVTPEELIDQASLVKQNAYHKFRVGAALLTDNGKIFTGCNVGNVVDSIDICAERAAICKAVSEGYRKFVAVAVISDKLKKITPCGSCRQALTEFGPKMTVYSANRNKDYDTFNLQELYPNAFGPDDIASD